MRYLAIIFTILLSACSSVSVSPEKQDSRSSTLYKYAQSSCIFWYFKSKEYDTEDIRAISAGIVETSNISLDVFTNISLFIKDYSPELSSKNDIDINLNKCFHLKESKRLTTIIMN